MPALATLAYPVLLGAMFGAYRVGRRRDRSPGDVFEWVRACSLALLAGALALVEVRLALAGLLASPVAALAAALGLASGVALVGLDLYVLWDASATRKEPSSAAAL